METTKAVFAESSQKGLEGKVVGLEEAIQDEKAKARWEAAE
jgi:hypothetical protein